jgi:hypothetical protein
VKKLKKGCLVRLDPKKCFTAEHGGELRYPLTNGLNDKRGTVESYRPTTHEEQSDWREQKRRDIQAAAVAGEDTFHIAFDSAGEPRLPPQATYILLHRDRTYQVIRARCRVRLGWGNPTPGLTKIICTHSGEETYVQSELLEVISQ